MVSPRQITQGWVALNIAPGLVRELEPLFEELTSRQSVCLRELQSQLLAQRTIVQTQLSELATLKTNNKQLTEKVHRLQNEVRSRR